MHFEPCRSVSEKHAIDGVHYIEANHIVSNVVVWVGALFCGCYDRIAVDSKLTVIVLVLP